MHKGILASVVVLGSVLTVACGDTPTSVQPLEVSAPSFGVRSGETFSYIKLTDPTATLISMGVGASRQMAATLYYSAGGWLPSAPYASWMSMDNCVATVTNASPSWGLVKGIKAGTAKIIVSAWGKADTVTVEVTGTGDLDPGCADRQWQWDYTDVSFTGTPATSYYVASGEVLKKVVLFAPKDTLAVGYKKTLRAEMWYSKGGKLNGKGYVSFSTTDGAIATISSGGVVLGKAPGRVKVIARLGSYADTVPLYVK